MLTKAKLKIYGRVQGVFYRQSTRDQAKLLGVTGWVRNMADGSVEAEVIGPSNRVEELISWCWQGPPSAQVTAVNIENREDFDLPDETTTGFEVR